MGKCICVIYAVLMYCFRSYSIQACRMVAEAYTNLSDNDVFSGDVNRSYNVQQEMKPRCYYKQRLNCLQREGATLNILGSGRKCNITCDHYSRCS
jgi:hypothetical protein